MLTHSLNLFKSKKLGTMIGIEHKMVIKASSLFSRNIVGDTEERTGNYNI